VSIYREILGAAAWDALPPALRNMHERGGAGTFTVVSRGFAKILSLLGYLPSAGNATVTLRIEREGGVERWIRSFNGEIFASTQRMERGIVAERIGISEIRYAVVPRGTTLHHEILSVRILGLAVPKWMLPRLEATERADGPRVHVNVAVGKAFRYTGALAPR
jgi:Domain of unknown function (DUF4166)